MERETLSYIDARFDKLERILLEHSKEQSNRINQLEKFTYKLTGGLAVIVFLANKLITFS